MKRLLYGSVMLLFLSAMLFTSCQNETSEKKPSEVSSEEPITLSKIANNSDVELHCAGSCGTAGACGLQGTVGAGGKYVMSCTCSGCVMHITITKGGKSKMTKVEAPFEVYYFGSFQTYMKEQYKDQKFSVVAYKFVSDGEENVETYSFDLGGKVGTVIVVGSAKRINDTRKIIDCTGSCDCREVYDLNTNKASCSCSDCRMKVTTVRDKN